jgi:excisionase family DNA binding protein
MSEAATEILTLTTAQLCVKWGVAERTLRRWRTAKENPLPFMMVGSRIVFDWADVKAWGYANADRLRDGK